MNISILLSVQIITLIFFIIRTYTSSYLKEKGKNIATKQDISEITSKIEEVRIEYNSQLESTKASLQLSLFSNQHFLEKSTEILLRFYDTLVLLRYDNLSKNMADVPSETADEKLSEFRNDTISKFTLLKVDYYRLLIFMSGKEDIMIDCNYMLEISFKLNETFDRWFSIIRYFLLNEVQSHKTSPEAYDKACKFRDEVVGSYQNDMRPIFHEFDEAIDGFKDSLMGYFEQKDLVEVKSHD